MITQRSAQQLMVFVSVGVVCVAIDISVLQGLVYLGTNYPVAVSLGFAAGLAANYFGHAKVTFKVSCGKSALFRFVVVVFVNYLITMLFVYLSMSMLNSVLIGKILSLPVVALNGYVLSRVWVFI